MSEVVKTSAISLQGLEGTVVTVETAVSQQLPGIAIIGLPDAAIAEAKHRVKVAIAQAGYKLSDRFITVNLSPADVQKHGTCFDLAIALGMLGASEEIAPAALTSTMFLAELGLTGQLRRPAGLLSMVVAARRAGFTEVLVPAEAAQEAALVPGVRVLGADTLLEAVQILSSPATQRFYTEPVADASASTETDGDALDIADVRGQEDAVRALTVAAAGGHHMSMIGPPGVGKTMLASRLPTILPPLSDDEALMVSSIASFGTSRAQLLNRTAPFCAPHHSASLPAIVGGGHGGRVTLGAVTKAAHGVLFLDEAPEFARTVLDSLRQPLETGTVEVARAGLHITLPANFQLILAANLCPCGNLGNGESSCMCKPMQRIRYQQKLSGPLRDRIDIRLHVRKPHLTDGDTESQTSAQIQERVCAARNRARERFRECSWSKNAEIPSRWLHAKGTKLDGSATAVIDQALSRGSLTQRGYDRILRLAWTLADLHDKERPDRSDVAGALSMREADYSE